MKKQTGGSAFPISDASTIHRIGGAAINGVTDMADRDRLYIDAAAQAGAGMTLRDYFAAKAMAALIAGDTTGSEVEAHLWAPSQAYEIADAMIEERAK